VFVSFVFFFLVMVMAMGKFLCGLVGAEILVAVVVLSTNNVLPRGFSVNLLTRHIYLRLF